MFVPTCNCQAGERIGGLIFFLFNRQRERVLNMVWFQIPAVNKHMMSAESVLTPPCLV